MLILHDTERKEHREKYHNIMDAKFSKTIWKMLQLWKFLNYLCISN